jgi:hypothetical protein
VVLNSTEDTCASGADRKAHTNTSTMPTVSTLKTIPATNMPRSPPPRASAGS